ncbi:aspartate aminotransferase family protein [Prescottella agglutinans]|uniref:Aspartate aminotransferase family protein n=1 Tax=Prescottella agglutinans TaxID=1644129 RepID=A0A3S3AXC2_9NOCA|nr:aminotransferase class III-fold pyridoxal phosphate-dependent enzyme [Prescottella agglutinans]RVW10735.1 aspartate aminotransferase family protein [Prescottella agglutinans]
MSTGAMLESDVLTDRYRRHFGGGRAALGRLIGDMAEVESSGAWITVADGRRFLDFGGYGVYLLGHRHPAVVEAVCAQIRRHPMASRVFLDPVSAGAAAALAEVTPGDLDLVHFVNSGAEATECALKLARAHGKTAVITTRKGFHGKTLGALSVTANAVLQRPFQPLLPHIMEVGFGDPAELEVALAATGGHGCFIVEPVQGEGGVHVPPPGYLRDAAELCRRYDALLIVDEVQTGLGRVGHWWGVDTDGVVPDLLLVGKGLSGGVMPIAAVVATPAAYAPFARDPYLHTSTFAGSPAACAAARAAIGVIRDEDLPARAAALGDRLLVGIRAAVARHGGGRVSQVRGRGLLLGLEMASGGLVGELFLNLLDRDVLANHSLNAADVLRFTPPATLTPEEVDLFLRALTDALADLTIT